MTQSVCHLLGRLEVFQLAARGLSNQEIAGERYLGETTVKTHLARILAKLGCETACKPSSWPTRPGAGVVPAGG